MITRFLACYLLIGCITSPSNLTPSFIKFPSVEENLGLKGLNQQLTCHSLIWKERAWFFLPISIFANPTKAFFQGKRGLTRWLPEKNDVMFSCILNFFTQIGGVHKALIAQEDSPWKVASFDVETSTKNDVWLIQPFPTKAKISYILLYFPLSPDFRRWFSENIWPSLQKWIAYS